MRVGLNPSDPSRKSLAVGQDVGYSTVNPVFWRWMANAIGALRGPFSCLHLRQELLSENLSRSLILIVLLSEYRDYACSEGCQLTQEPFFQ